MSDIVNCPHVSLEICNQLLKQIYPSNKQPTINSVSINKFSDKKLGYMADHLLLTITTSENQIKFFVKTFPDSTYPIMKKYVQQSNVFGKEIFMYTNLFPKFKAVVLEKIDFIPTCYYTNKNLIIFEDLTEKQYKLCESSQFDSPHIKLTLETIALLHAISIAYEQKTDNLITQEFSDKLTDGINRNDQNFSGFLYLQAAHKGLIHAINLMQLKKFDKSDFVNHLNEIFNDIFTVLSQNPIHRNVLNHGDLWPMNILFQYENNQPKHCKLVDFQLIRYSPPANDVLYFLLHAVDHNTPHTQLQKYLKFYYIKLSQLVGNFGFNLNGILPLKEFEITCNLLLPPLKLKHAYQIMFQQADIVYMKNIYDSSEVYTKSLFEDRSEMIEYFINADDRYKCVVQEMIWELECIVEKKLKRSNYFMF